jgi:hypothetical protein
LNLIKSCLPKSPTSSWYQSRFRSSPSAPNPLALMSGTIGAAVTGTTGAAPVTDAAAVRAAEERRLA